MPAPAELIVNTGPLLALAAAGRAQFALTEFRAAPWLEKREEPTPLTPLLQASLDPGEAAVIALAITEKVAAVAIDEALGRRMARLHGLALTGSLGILIKAKQRGLPVLVRPAIESMRRHGIWLSPALEKE